MGDKKKELDKLSISQSCFLNMLKESSGNGKRFCFILGSGVSRSSGIPTGIDMSRTWVSEIEERYKGNEKEIEGLMQQLEIKDISIKSDNYFDIYNLRFFPDYGNGYAYLEKKMENAEPGFGYYPLVRFLTTTESNLVITTNFDSLVEDALFIYTKKRPIVVGHESLAEFIDVNTKRPIVAKLHRGLFFNPLNRREELQELSEEWKKVLRMVFRVFTPIVIGYGGGDRTLMKFLADESVELNGIFWCYVRDEKEEGDGPGDEIIRLVKGKKGYFVPIAGFDEMMFMLERTFQYENPDGWLRKAAEEKIELYNRQFEEFSKKMDEILEPTKEQKEVKASLGDYADKEKAALLELIEKEPSAENYYKLGNRERISKNHKKAVEYYTEAIKAGLENASIYNSRGNSYRDLKEYEKSIEDYNKALALDPGYLFVYNNRGNSYDDLGEHGRAIEDYNKAIELDPKYAYAYNGRGLSYKNLGNYEKAMEDFNKAIELKPEYATAYNSRGIIYHDLGENEKAVEDYNKAIELNPEYAFAYNNRGNSYGDLGKLEEAFEDYNKAIELYPEYAEAYNNRGVNYSNSGKKEKAIEDYSRAIGLNSGYARAYKNRGLCYKELGEEEKARQDFKRAAELDPKFAVK